MTAPSEPLEQTATGIDRRRLLGVTAVAGLGIATLPLPSATAAASTDGGTVPETLSGDFEVNDGDRFAVYVFVFSESAFEAGEIRLRIVGGPGASATWYSPYDDEYLEGPPGAGEGGHLFYFDLGSVADLHGGRPAYMASLLDDKTVTLIVGRFDGDTGPIAVSPILLPHIEPELEPAPPS